MDLGLKDAAAVVVGGGRGMGLAAARCLADDGARIAVVGRTAAVLDEAAKDLAQRGSPDAARTRRRHHRRRASPAGVRRTEHAVGWRTQYPRQRRRSRRRRHVRRSDRRSVARRVRRRRDGHGALRPVRAPTVAKGRLGSHRQLLRPLHATTERDPARVHRRQGGTDERHEESVPAAGQGRDHGQRRLAGQHRVGGAGRLGRVRSGSTATTRTR